MKEIKVSVPDGKKAEWQDINGVQTLVLVDEKDERPVMERIKTFEDACKELNRLAEEGNEDMAILLADYESNADNIKTEATLAYMKLCIIVAALNEGWVPTFEKGEYRWFPWYYLYTKEEVDAMDEDEKRRVVGRANNSAYPYGGCVYAYAYYDSSGSNASHGARLAFRDRERAEYAGRQFAELYVRYYYDAKLENL